MDCNRLFGIALNEAHSRIDNKYEMMISNHAMTFTERRVYQKNWKFEDTELSQEDKEWLNANFEEEEEENDE